MTIVIALKVGDGVVLGADSASTLSGATGQYYNSYFNAEKLYNLVKGLPIGVVTFGLGGLADRSISSHAKDLRQLLTNRAEPDWYLDQTTYTIEEVAERVREYFFGTLYSKAVPANTQSPAMGFMIAGYGANSYSAEVWKVVIEQGGKCGAPVPIIPASQPVGAQWEGLPEACCRLILGWSPQIMGRLVAAGMTEQDAANLLNSVEPMIHPTMPIQDAIDLVDYMVEVTCGFVRFAPGPATVAKPIDTAVITKHEGFHWVHRKHYYSRDLNLPHPVPDGPLARRQDVL